MNAYAPAVNLVAQQGGGGALLWVMVLAAAIVVGSVVLLHLRRRLLGSSDESAGTMTLEDIRRLHSAGKISDEEFARLKDRLITGSRPKERHATVEALQRRKGPADPPGEPNK
jgi:uncharacterized membrane protein